MLRLSSVGNREITILQLGKCNWTADFVVCASCKLRILDATWVHELWGIKLDFTFWAGEKMASMPINGLFPSLFSQNRQRLSQCISLHKQRQAALRPSAPPSIFLTLKRSEGVCTTLAFCMFLLRMSAQRQRYCPLAPATQCTIVCSVVKTASSLAVR